MRNNWGDEVSSMVPYHRMDAEMQVRNHRGRERHASGILFLLTLASLACADTLSDWLNVATVAVLWVAFIVINHQQEIERGETRVREFRQTCHRASAKAIHDMDRLWREYDRGDRDGPEDPDRETEEAK